MRIRGNGERNFIVILTMSITMMSVGYGVGQRVLSIFGIWLTLYYTCVFIREIEITDSQLIIKRLGRKINIRKGSITDVDINKNTISIYSDRYAGINFYKCQIKKKDLPKLLEQLSKYTI